MEFPNYEKSLKTLYRLETYRFNLALFTASADSKNFPIQQIMSILGELESLRITIDAMSNVLLSEEDKEHSIIVWTNKHHTLDNDFIFEFISIETAASVLNIDPYKIKYICESRSALTINNLRVSYKQDFDITIGNLK